MKKDGNLLINYVKNGDIKPTDRNGNLQCPVLYAAECGFG